METTAAKAKGRSRDCNKDCNGDRNGDRNADRNRGRNGGRNGDRNEKPTTVNPTKGTPTMVMPALASQDVAADDCHAFIGVQIPKEETVFKTASLKKAKAEMPKTFLELVLLQDVLDAIGKLMEP
jgi:hypothetical protein